MFVMNVSGNTLAEVAKKLAEAGEALSKGAVTLTDATPAEASTTDKPKRGRPAKAKEEEFDLDGETEEKAEEEETPAATREDVIRALKAYGEKHGRDKAVAALKKFKVKSVRDLKDDQFQDLIDMVS